jgi:hypothetical protein
MTRAAKAQFYSLMMKSSFRISHTVLLWFFVLVVLKFLPCAQVFPAFTPSPPLILFALNLPCSWRPWPMPYRVWFMQICFFLFFCPIETTHTDDVPVLLCCRNGKHWRAG